MNPTVCWPDKTLPVEIYCTSGVLTGLEIAASDGLLAMPRCGLGVGGLLLGRRAGTRIEIGKFAEIFCSHALGPGFILTPEEIAAASEQERQADSLEVVGWYCSKTRGTLTLSRHDQDLFAALCPEPWQAALIIRPSLGKTTLAAFGFRASGVSEDPFLLGLPLELAWQELTAPRESAKEPPPEVEEAETPEAAIPTTPVSGTIFGELENAGTAAPPELLKPRLWPLRLLIAAIALAMLLAAFLARRY